MQTLFGFAGPRTSLALGTRSGKERAGDPVPRAGREDGAVRSVCHRLGMGIKGPPRRWRGFSPLTLKTIPAVCL